MENGTDKEHEEIEKKEEGTHPEVGEGKGIALVNQTSPTRRKPTMQILINYLRRTWSVVLNPPRESVRFRSLQELLSVPLVTTLLAILMLKCISFSLDLLILLVMIYWMVFSS